MFDATLWIDNMSHHLSIIVNDSKVTHKQIGHEYINKKADIVQKITRIRTRL